MSARPVRSEVAALGWMEGEVGREATAGLFLGVPKDGKARWAGAGLGGSPSALLDAVVESWRRHCHCEGSRDAGDVSRKY